MGTAGEALVGKVVAAFELRTVRGEGIDLAFGVRPLEQARWASPSGIAADDDHVVAPTRELTLHADEPLAQVEDQVVPLVRDGLRHADTQLDSRVNDRRFGDSAPLIGRELHALDRSRGLGWAASV